MPKLTLTKNPKVAEKFKTYPKAVGSKLHFLRDLILEVAEEQGIETLEETLKWGEPSYLAKKGSTLRIDWKSKAPQQYAMYFKCSSKLVPTFKECFGTTFTYEKNRAIVFNLQDAIPTAALKKCIRLALTYHSVKHLPKLGL